MLLSALLLAAFNPQTHPVTFSYEVGRTDLAVAKLAEISGLPMKATGPVGSEIVFISVQNRPLAEIMKSLASVTCSRWEKKPDGTYELSRPAAMAERERSKELNRKLKALSAWRDKLVSCLEEPYTPENLLSIVAEKPKLDTAQTDANLTPEQLAKAAARLDHVTHCDPVFRALARCLFNLDLTPMASLEPEAAVTFGTEPNAVQLPLPEMARDAVNALQPEQLVWGKALKTLPIAEGQTAEDRFQTDSTIRFFVNSGDTSDRFSAQTEPWQRTLPFTKKPAHAVVTASCYSEDAYQIKLQMFSEAGKQILEFEASDINTWEDTNAPAETKGAVNRPKPLPEDLAFQARIKASGARIQPEIEKLKRFFDDPVQNDPLWLSNQTALTEFAAQKQKPVVACLADTTRADIADYWLDGPSTVGMEITEAGPTVEIRPSNFAKHWRHRVAREAMIPCFQAFHQDGRIDILSFVRLLATSQDSANMEFGCSFTQLIDPTYKEGFGSFNIPFQCAFAPLLASLSIDQLKHLKVGDSIAYSALTDQQQALVARIVYGVRVNVSEEGQPPQGLAEFDPTFELPRGLLLGAGLSATFGEDQIVVFHNGSGPDDDFYRFNVSDKDQFTGWEGPPPRLPPGGMDTVTYEVKRNPVIVLKCGMTPGHAVIGKFSEPLRNSNQKRLTFGELPEEVQRKLEGVMKMFKSFEKDLGKGPTKP